MTIATARRDGTVTVMMVLMMEMVLMMIPMMPGVMAMTMAAIPPSGRKISR